MAAHRLIVLVFVLAILLLTHAAPGSGSNGKVQFEWEVLTSKNFSSQIRLHPHVLLLVTVPWCGQSRSVMRDLSLKLEKEHDKYRPLKLMVVHRNFDKVLAKSLDADEGITVLCYHHAVSYRYQGSLRAQDILSSVHYLTSTAPKELPLKRLNNSEDLDMFLASTDMAILLLESCGWTEKLLMEHYGNETLLSFAGGVLADRLNKETNRTLASGGQKNLKGMGNEMISSEADNGCGRSLWVGEFSAQNETVPLTDEDIHTTFEMSCSFEEYKKFESFFLKFLTVARDFYLPPRRQRYGLVSERLLLSPLGVEVSDQWCLIVSYAGCPGCLKVLKEGSYLHDVIERHDLPVMELADKGGDIGPSLPINTPSVLLFIDRTSDSAETRRRSWESLHAFKEVALQYWKPNQVDGKNIDWPKRSSVHTHEGSANLFGSQRLLLSHSSQKIKLNDKMSIMIINEGEQVTLDSEATSSGSSSLHEILTYLVGQKKRLKLSSLAKEAGFQLLSDDIDIKLADVPSSRTDSDNQDSSENAIEVSDKDLHMNEETDKISSVEQGGEESQPLRAEAPSADAERKAPGNLGTEESALSDPHQSLNSDDIASPMYLDSTVQTYVLSEKSANLKHQPSGFTGSFLFSECNYQFLRSLTNSSQVPRIVIIDPILQQHHVLSDIADLSSNSISAFIDEFLNGSLIPYQRSGPLRNSVEMPYPPLVNLDFHEKDSLPSITSEMFSELVFGLGQPDDQNATNPWHKDVLVLFSSSWCGFCQRMELVVREVYRALKGYMDMVNSDSKEEFLREELKDNVPRVPAIYSIDCTLNDCGLILSSMGQREVYPTLLLFPAESKTPIPYDGNMMVTDVIKFIADHGRNSHHLSREKGTLWVDEKERDDDDDQLRGESMSRGGKDPPLGKDWYFRAVDRNGESTNEGTFKPNAAPQKIAVGSYLIATEHLHGLNLFSEAKILIVSADHDMGFQGLIVNKPISWDSIKFEDANLAELLKEAPLSFGGPVIKEGLPFVSLTRNSLNEQHPQVLPGVYFLDPLATLYEIEKLKAGNQSATNYWFFWGYSGWGWDQLFGEINGEAWNVHEGKPEDLQWP